jgi:peptide/nickel transport system permease protein
MFIIVPTLVWGLTAAAVFGLSPLTAGLANAGLAIAALSALLSYGFDPEGASR